MYCKNCGKEIDEGKPFCPYCGQPVTPREDTSFRNNEIGGNDGSGGYYGEANAYPAQKKTNNMCVIGMVVSICSMIFPLASIAGIIISIIGIRNFDEQTETGRGYGIAGIIIGACILIFTVLLLLLLFGSFFGIIKGLGQEIHWYLN